MPDDAEYQRLKKIWYRKLEKSGFTDIEQDEDTLKVWSTKASEYRSPLENSARQTYYNMAYQFLNQYEFKSKRDRVIWEYHSQGISYRTISNLLRSRHFKSLTYNGIYLRVKILAKIMFETYK